MAKDQNGSPRDGRGDGEEEEARSGSKSVEADREGHSKGSRDRSHRGKSKRREEEEEGSGSSGEDSSERRKRRRKEKERRRRRRSRSESSGSSSESESESSYSGSSAESKRPEFTAWLSEVKQVNLEALSNWEEKQMFKEFMEDHNTATFPSKKYYNLDAYHRKATEKEKKKGLKTSVTERTVFNDEEQRRLELLKERERRKEEEVEALKRSMQAGLAQDMKEQARLREEMNYQYRLGNFQSISYLPLHQSKPSPLSLPPAAATSTISSVPPCGLHPPAALPSLPPLP
ncbi:hypothetical protein C2845_PM15G15480 [Panicum miliaceum]|uniref:Uncharacterized protein n=1 Tax=Panicum miliaceum TaxID=4540 RepID=A0A3L6Q8F3_PANMI|nr:hypothetical protein C2845_PM15G15480 [Panicum miliaceum]